MAVTEEMVREQLRKVIDPELFVNIVDLGLIYVIELGESAANSTDAAADSVEATAADESAPPQESTSPAEAAPAEATAAESPSTDQQPAPDASDTGDAEADAATADGVPVKIDMTMTSPMCPAGPQLVANSKQVVGQLEGVGEVEVRVVMDPPWTPDLMTDDAKDQLGIF